MNQCEEWCIKQSYTNKSMKYLIVWGKNRTHMFVIDVHDEDDFFAWCVRFLTKKQTHNKLLLLNLSLEKIEVKYIYVKFPYVLSVCYVQYYTKWQKLPLSNFQV